jgi:hypothetical protein
MGKFETGHVIDAAADRHSKNTVATFDMRTPELMGRR